MTDEVFPERFFEFLSSYSPEEWLVYLTIRALRKKKFPVKKEILVELLPMSEFVVSDCLKKLKMHGWLQSGLQLVGEPKKKETPRLEKKAKDAWLVKCHQSLSAKDMRGAMGTKKESDKVTNRDLYKYYCNRYEETFLEPVPFMRSEQALTYMGRARASVNDDVGYMKDIIDFLCENWSRIKDELKLKTLYPSVSLIGSAFYWNSIRNLKEKGFEINLMRR